MRCGSIEEAGRKFEHLWPENAQTWRSNLIYAHGLRYRGIEPPATATLRMHALARKLRAMYPFDDWEGAKDQPIVYTIQNNRHSQGQR